jgi:hypothetical protein
VRLKANSSSARPAPGAASENKASSKTRTRA